MAVSPSRVEGSGRERDPVTPEHLHYLWNIRRAYGDLVVDGGEHLSGQRALTGDFQHLTTASSVAKAMHRSSRHVNERARRAEVVLPVALKLNLTVQDVERLVPVVAVRGRPRSLVTLLQRDAVALRRGVGRQDSYLGSKDIQGGVALIGT